MQRNEHKYIYVLVLYVTLVVQLNKKKRIIRRKNSTKLNVCGDNTNTQENTVSDPIV